jgi:hypothetical protein
MVIRPQELHQLLMLLTDERLQAETADRVVQRVLLALEDPETYVVNYPDEEWIVEGCDLLASSEGSMRLLHWILRQELADWLMSNPDVDAVAEQVVDQLHERGIAIADPAHRFATLTECRQYLSAALAASTNSPQSKAIIEIELGETAGLLVVAAAQLPQLLVLSKRAGLQVAA